ncbi:MAG TPA: efflux RND transporter periplasmic adaptor subunit [Anaerolineales bacterium]|nr:efflux RND transporter periplasmic adaptor subunit [Anaerolineales bacterium]
MRRFYWSTLLSLTAILAILVNPVFAAQEGTVVASAVIVPAQVAELGFITSALIKEITVKEGEQVRAGQTLAVLDTPELQFAVIAAEAALRSAQGEEKVQSYRRVKDRRHGRVFFDIVPPEVRQIAHARVQQAQAALEVAQATLAQTTLVAPYDATVASIDVVPGEYVQQNQVVVTLATLNTMQIETTDLSERDIPKVKIGAPANVFIEALNENVNGTVIGISSIANTVGGDVVFKVTIGFDKQPEHLLWGMSAEVTIGK